MAFDKEALNVLRMDRKADDEALRRRSRPWLLVIIAGGIVVLGLLAWLLVKPSVIGVKTAIAKAKPIAAEGGAARVLNASGYVVPRLQAVVSSKVTGKVNKVLIEEGMHVKAGQVLATLDDATARDQVNVAQSRLEAALAQARQAEVEHANAALDLKRTRTLFSQHLISQAAMDAAVTKEASLNAAADSAIQQVAVARNALKLDRQLLEDTVIRAPFSGVVVSKDAQPGEMISPMSAGGGFTRTGICTVVDMTSLEIEVDVNESYIHRVRDGQKVDAVLDAYPNWHIPSHVISIIPTANRDKATVKVRIGFDKLDPRLLPQMAVQVWFLDDEREASQHGAVNVTIPAVAVHRDATTPYVYIFDNGWVERRAIKVGAQTGTNVEVLAGLQGGEHVIVSADKPVSEGSRVREVPAS